MKQLYAYLIKVLDIIKFIKVEPGFQMNILSFHDLNILQHLSKLWRLLNNNLFRGHNLETNFSLICFVKVN